jgi:hypothetical protein
MVGVPHAQHQKRHPHDLQLAQACCVSALIIGVRGMIHTQTECVAFVAWCSVICIYDLGLETQAIRSIQSVNVASVLLVLPTGCALPPRLLSSDSGKLV